MSTCLGGSVAVQITGAHPKGETQLLAITMFDADTTPELRKQILTYHAAATMTDRERARFLGLPEGCRIREGAKILAPEKFKCGHHVWIGEGAILDAQGGLTIGDYTQVGLNVMIWSHTSIKQALKGETCRSRDSINYRATSIGRRCWIGGPSVIYPGVTIGDEAVILPMSVVDSDIPSGTWVKDNRLCKEQARRLEQLESMLEQQQARIKKLEEALEERAQR
jgi:acetyltransferase-like isoleucine patch superfamily enzyme